MEADRITSRRGARRLTDIPEFVLGELSSGRCESVNLMEWLAADMCMLARSVADETKNVKLKQALIGLAQSMSGQSITSRLLSAGSAIAGSVRSQEEFLHLSTHKSDLVRQWACYAVNDPAMRFDTQTRLKSTLLFAADSNMSVRETAWMAFRPALLTNLDFCLSCLTPLASDVDANIRRFAVEVSRPRSVWGAHISQLKRNPSLAQTLIEPLKDDSAKYVQLSVGNWLNDASKTRPDWVLEICNRWAASGGGNTLLIVKRALRTLTRTASSLDQGELIRGFADPLKLIEGAIK